MGHAILPAMRSLALLLASVCVSLGLLAAPALAGDATPWAAGDRVEAFELDDQHGEVGRVDESVRMLLFTSDMGAGKLVRSALEADPGLQDLDARAVAYVSDIQGMPRLVSRLMAVPAMRRRPYRMLLDRTGETSARIPRQGGEVTVIVLDALEVRSVGFADSAEAVAAALEGADSPSTP